MRRPRLTRKRTEGLQLIGEIVDQQLLQTLLSRQEIRKVKTARRWITDTVAHRAASGAKETHRATV